MRGADHFAQLNAEAHGVVPQHFAGASLHHLCAHIEAREQRIERTGRSVEQEELVEAAMLHPTTLLAEMRILDVNLRGLAERGQLLMRALGDDDAGAIRAQIAQAHAEAAAEQRVEFHEAGPGFVEQNVVAQMTDATNDFFRRVDGAVVGALLHHRRAEGPRPIGQRFIRHQRVGANRFAQALLVHRLEAHWANQAVGVAFGLHKHRHRAAQKQGAVMRGLMVVAIEQHQIAFGQQRRQHHLVRG